VLLNILFMIHLIITTANIQDNFEVRREQYIKSIDRANEFSYLFDSCTILECFSEHEQYLNDYNTYYSKIPNTYPEKGLNEMAHLKGFLQQSHFSADDMIVKLTGRYLLEDNSFFIKLGLLQENYDAIFKDDSDIYEGRGFHTFLYSVRLNTFLDTINSLNFSTDNLDPIEWGVKSFLKDYKGLYLLNRLGVKAFQGTFSDKIFSC